MRRRRRRSHHWIKAWSHGIGHDCRCNHSGRRGGGFIGFSRFSWRSGWSSGSSSTTAIFDKSRHIYIVNCPLPFWTYLSIETKVFITIQTISFECQNEWTYSFHSICFLFYELFINMISKLATLLWSILPYQHFKHWQRRMTLSKNTMWTILLSILLLFESFFRFSTYT